MNLKNVVILMGLRMIKIGDLYQDEYRNLRRVVLITSDRYIYILYSFRNKNASLYSLTQSNFKRYVVSLDKKVN